MISMSFFQFSKIFLLFYISICILELALLAPKQNKTIATINKHYKKQNNTHTQTYNRKIAPRLSLSQV